MSGSGGGGKGGSGGGSPWGIAGALGLGLGQQWSNNPNIGFGGSSEHNLLDQLDPIGKAITKIGGDPLNLYGNKDNPNALLFPSQNSQGANGGVPSVLPNLGAQSLISQAPQGGFMPLGQTNPMGGQTPGIFNQMAAQSAGQLFNPSSQFTPPTTSSTPSSKGAISTPMSVNTNGTPYSSIALPGGGGNPALDSPSGSALSRSQIHGGNVGPTGVTEPADPAFLNQLHNGMMAALKAQYGINQPLNGVNTPIKNPNGGNRFSPFGGRFNSGAY